MNPDQLCKWEALSQGMIAELSDLDLEAVVGGKEGGGGGGGGDSVMKGFARLSAFQDFQERNFRINGINPGSRAGER